MGINNQEMSAHLLILGILSKASNSLGKNLTISYKKKKFENEYRGIYFTDCYELYLNKKYITTVYGDTIRHNSYYIVKVIKVKLKPVCKLKRIKDGRKFVRI